MNQRIKKLWIKALRSGKYKQKTCALRGTRGDGDEGFCCLGVLTEVFRKDTNRGRWKKSKRDDGDYFFFLKGSHEEGGVLPAVVAEWAGLGKRQDPGLRGKRASSFNDSGKDFDFIADRIEKYL